MSSINRRDFLKLMASLPMIKLVGDLSDRGFRLAHISDPDAPNVIVVIFDALSALNMSLYGYPRQTTPNISNFAQNATVFHRHYAGGNFTSPGTASILTGTYPWTHRAYHLFATVAQSLLDKNLFHGFTDNIYERMAFTHNDLASILLHQFGRDIDLQEETLRLSLFNENLLTDRLFNKDHNAAYLGEKMVIRGQRGQDFQLPTSLFLSIVHRFWRNNERHDLTAEYHDQYPRGLPSANAETMLYLLEDSIDWVRDTVIAAEKPFFGYFHFLPPHEPYNTRKDFINIFKNDGFTPPEKPPHIFSQGYTQDLILTKRRKYDEYIAFVDSEFGRLVDALQKAGMLETTYLILTSDHGEMFERGILEHITETLFEPITHIPLLIHSPGQNARVDIQAPTNSVDLLPTVYRAIGDSSPGWCEGSILPIFPGITLDNDRSIYTVEAKSNPKNAPLQHGTVALVKGQYKIIHYFGHNKARDNYEAYDLGKDPEEMNDLYPSQSPLVKDLQNELLSKIGEVNRPHPIN